MLSFRSKIIPMVGQDNRSDRGRQGVKDQIRVHAMQLDRAAGSRHVSGLLARLPGERAAHIRRFRRADDALRSIGGSLLSRDVLCRHLGIGHDELRIARTEKGKPKVTSHSDIHFSVSHSGKWVVCAVHNTPVGVDLEQIRPIEPEIPPFCLNTKELNAMQAAPAGAQRQLFFELWTRKESYLKMAGSGLAEDPRACRIPRDVHFRQYAIQSGYVATACGRKPDFDTSVEQIDFEDAADRLQYQCMEVPGSG